MKKNRKIILSEKEMPRQWYNILADMPNKPLPPLHPATRQPVGPQDLAAIFPMELIKQEVASERYIDIPDEVLDLYKIYRPSPLYRAINLEKELGTKSRIYYKYEGGNYSGSHKANTAIAQAYYNKKEGVRRITTETGAGQWGSALAMGCKFIGLECKVYMVRVSYNQKPYRRILMETFGAKVVPSPSQDTQIGRRILAETPDSTGSLGIAISEAVEDAFGRDDTFYSLGSVLNHVLMHQTVVGQEAKKQMEMAGAYPDMIVGCVGGGSNFAGTFLPFIPDKLRKKKKIQIIAVEPEACPSLTKGPYTWDYGDVAGMAPIAKMYTVGHNFVPPPVHAGGLRYHGMAPIVSHLVKLGLVEARAEHQVAVFRSAVTFAQAEGIIPAPEPAHAIKVVIDEALKCKESGEKKTILLALSGHGHFDLGAYDEYLRGKLVDYEFPQQKMEEALAQLPKVPA